jgi:exosortase
MIQANDPVPQPADARNVRAVRYSYVKQQTAAALSQAVNCLPTHWWLYVAITVALMGAFYQVDLRAMGNLWAHDASWSHGFLVPLFAAFFVFLQWDTLKRLPAKGEMWGLGLFVFGVATHVLFLMTGQFHMSEMSLLVVGFGLVLFLLGVEHLKLLWLPIGFLAFMIPPPQALYVKLTTPMQYISAEAGVHLLPLMGITAEREGTQVKIFTHGVWESLNVVEACSGVRMLMAFLALAVALAYTTSRPMVQKLFLAGCAVPIAIACNALRVTVIGVLFATANRDYARSSTHEYIGLLMLGPAMLMQIGVAWVLDRLFIEVPPTGGAAEAAV